MGQLAVKVDVDTLRGTREGVPRLLEIFEKASCPALFLFSFGPDNTGKALSRIFRPGFLKKCLRSNVASNYGPATLMYGTLLPAPTIYKKCSGQIKAVRNAGFECGVHSWDHYRWQDKLQRMGIQQIAAEFNKALMAYRDVLGENPDCCGAAGWQCTPDSLKVQDASALLYCSDTRGTRPFMPKMGEETFNTLQIPTTLPTLDEMLGLQKLENISSLYLDLFEKPGLHVLTVHAELEGMAYANWFEKLLKDAVSRSVEFVSLRQTAEKELKQKTLIPVNEIQMLPHPGRSGLLATQV